MAAALIDNLRRGQAKLDDQLLAEALTLDGSHSAEAIAVVNRSCEPGHLGLELVSRGQLSVAELDRLSAEIEVATLMESVGGATPEDVRAASADEARRIGRYVLVDELGAGGMGVVWKAWDGKLSRWVAIKQVKVQEPQLIRRFMQEAKLLAGLAHAHITQVYEVGVNAGKPFLVMELVDGYTPGSDGAIPRKEAAAIVRDAAMAVQFAHEHGIVHRDLKPSNLLVSKRGRVFVTDFGLARMREEGNNLTQTGALLGTPAFMAPEQAQAKPADNRTDIYGLGATLYALVSGEPPHTGELVHEIVKRVAMSNPPTLMGSDDLVVVAQKAMERDSEDRYTSAGELAADLQRFIDDEPIAARPINSVERVWRRAKRRPVFSAVVLTCLLVVTGIGGYATSRFSQYLERQSQIAAAKGPVAEAEAVAADIKRLVLLGQIGTPTQRAAIERLDGLVEEALQLAPGYADALFLQGMAALWKNDLETAVRLFGEALREDPDHLEARARRATINLNAAAVSPSVVQDSDGLRLEVVPLSPSQTERYQLVEEELLLLPPDYPLRRLADSMLHSVRGEFVEQREALEEYLDENSYDVKARSMLPWPLLALGDYAGVERTSRQLLDEHLFPGLAQYLLALSYGGRLRFNEAVEAMAVYYRMTGGTDAFQWFTTWAALAGKPELALDTLATLLSEQPDDFDVRMGRVKVALDLGLPEVASKHARALLADQADNGLAHFYLGLALMDTDRDGAVAAFLAATDDAEIAPDAWIELGWYRFDLGAFPESLEAFQQAAGLVDSANVHYGQFLGHIQLGHSEAAIVAIDRAIALEPDLTSFRIYKGIHQTGLQNFDSAREEFAIAAALSPDDPSVFKAAVTAWQNVDRKNDARAAALAWVKAQPANEDARRTLGELNP